MIRELVEKTMKGPRFHPEMREAFFGFGMKPPEFDERIDDVRVRGEGLDRFRVVLDLTRTRRGTEEEVRTLVPTRGYDSPVAAELMADWMKAPENLARANQVLEVSGNIRDQLLVAAAASGAFAVGVALRAPIF
jgi:hypothetical protein